MDTVDKAYFREEYKKVFGRALSDAKFNNISLIIDAYDTNPRMKSLRWLAYILGTSMHESNDTFAPVVEGYWIKPESRRIGALKNYYLKNNPGAYRTIFPSNGKFYYGRGRVTQLTHDFNYKFASEKIYKDTRLYDNPNLIIEDINCDMQVTFTGMLEGWFRGKGNRLEVFFPLGSRKADWVKARGIINHPSDHAHTIASYAIKLYDCLEYAAASGGIPEVTTAENVSVPDEEVIKSELAAAVNVKGVLEGFADQSANFS